MGAKTEIAWTDATWSPLRARVKENAAEIAREKGYTSLIQIAEKMAGHVGPHCEHCSPGCEICYSGRDNHRCLPSNGTGLPFDRRSRDLVDPIVDEKILLEPRAGWKSAVARLKAAGWFSNPEIAQVRRVMAKNGFRCLEGALERGISDRVRKVRLADLRDTVQWFVNEAKESGIRLGWLFE